MGIGSHVWFKFLQKSTYSVFKNENSMHHSYDYINKNIEKTRVNHSLMVKSCFWWCKYRGLTFSSVMRTLFLWRKKVCLKAAPPERKGGGPACAGTVARQRHCESFESIGHLGVTGARVRVWTMAVHRGVMWRRYSWNNRMTSALKSFPSGPPPAVPHSTLANPPLLFGEWSLHTWLRTRKACTDQDTVCRHKPQV